MNANLSARTFHLNRAAWFRLALMLVLAIGLLPAHTVQAAALPDLVTTRAWAVRNLSGVWIMGYTVKNAGAAPAGPFRITIRNGAGVILRDFLAAGLAAGQARNYSIAAGLNCRFTRVIVLDRDRRITESNEANNIRWYQHYCAKPDLTVTNITPRWNGTVWYMDYTIKNIGTSPAGAFKISIRSVYSGAIIQEFLYPGLAVGQTRTLTYDVLYCEFDLEVVLDRDNRILELNELNNVRRFTHIC